MTMNPSRPPAVASFARADRLSRVGPRASPDAAPELLPAKPKDGPSPPRSATRTGCPSWWIPRRANRDTDFGLRCATLPPGRGTTELLSLSVALSIDTFGPHVPPEGLHIA
jgi:hypothetical protein